MVYRKRSVFWVLFVVTAFIFYQAYYLISDVQVDEKHIQRQVGLIPEAVTLKSYQTMTDNKAVEERQTERKRVLERFCANIPAEVRAHNARNPWSYKLNVKDKYLYCPVPKSGWSSWKRLWFYTSGVINSYDTDVGIQSDEKAGIKDVRGLRAIRDSYQNGRYKYSFVFVRNPWERLVSAYINKAVDYNYTRILHTPCKWESMDPYKPNLSFEQFLRCIAESKTPDMHWTPQWKLCNFCSITYDFIGHLDTVREDSSYVISKIGLNASYPHSFPSKTKFKDKKSVSDWYADLPVDLLKKLQLRFKYDFEMHGFNPQPPNRDDVNTS